MFGMGYEKMSKRTLPAVLLVSAPRSLINEVILCSDRFLFPKFRGDISPWISSSRLQAPVRSTPFCSPWNASPNGQFSSPLYQIELPPDWRIFNIFHVSLLRPFTPLFDSQTPTPPPPIELSEDVSIPVYQVANILNSIFRQPPPRSTLSLTLNNLKHPLNNLKPLHHHQIRSYFDSRQGRRRIS